MAEAVRVTLARALADHCRDRLIPLDTRLRLLDGLDPDELGSDRSGSTSPARPTIDGPDGLGRAHEALVEGAAQAVRGAWYTPEWLAAALVADAVTDTGRVADPSCGGGAFLLAAADRLLALGASPSRIVTELVWGADIDPVAVAVSEAALWLWSAGHGEPAVAGDALVVGDPLIDVVIPPVHVVVGNPPFLGQLRTATAVDRARRDRLRVRWGSAVQPYTDAAWLFLLAAVEAVRPGGSVTLVQPQSLLGARDAEAVRDRVDALAVLEDCWVDDGRTFDANVVCCAPRLRRVDPGPRDPAQPAATNQWQRPLVDAAGIPSVVVAVGEVVADRAAVTAGFRDEYYGLVSGVVESGAGPRLVTSGAIDPLRVRDVPVRFARRAWDRPTVERAALVGRSAAWVDAQRAPKLIVASQTRVLEAVADPDGSLIAGVPAIVVTPRDGDDLWLLAAAIHAPVSSAWMAARTVGTALARDACRPTAALVGALPLPTDRVAWERAADLARDLARRAAIGTGDDGDRAEAWAAFGRAADLAYGVEDPAVLGWWLARLPLR